MAVQRGSGSIWSAYYHYDKDNDVDTWTHPSGFTITNNVRLDKRVDWLALPGIGRGQAGGSTICRMRQFSVWIECVEFTCEKSLRDRRPKKTGVAASRVKNCAKQISNYDKTLQQGLKSTNLDVRKAAAAYGTLGDKN